MNCCKNKSRCNGRVSQRQTNTKKESSMKKNETLIYKLADVGDETVTMEVRLHKTPSRYWSFFAFL